MVRPFARSGYAPGMRSNRNAVVLAKANIEFAFFPCYEGAGITLRNHGNIGGDLVVQNAAGVGDPSVASWLAPSRGFRPGVRSVNAQACTTSNGSAVIAVADSSSMRAGQRITGTGIPANTYIASVDNATQITGTKNCTASGASTITCYDYILAALTPTHALYQLMRPAAGETILAGAVIDEQSAGATAEYLLSFNNINYGNGGWQLRRSFQNMDVRYRAVGGSEQTIGAAGDEFAPSGGSGRRNVIFVAFEANAAGDSMSIDYWLRKRHPDGTESTVWDGLNSVQAGTIPVTQTADDNAGAVFGFLGNGNAIPESAVLGSIGTQSGVYVSNLFIARCENSWYNAHGDELEAELWQIGKMASAWALPRALTRP